MESAISAQTLAISEALQSPNPDLGQAQFATDDAGESGSNSNSNEDAGSSAGQARLEEEKAKDAVPATKQHKEQSLDSEISSVISNLTSFWGAIKKESEATFASVTSELTGLQQNFEEVKAKGQKLLDQSEQFLDKSEIFLQKGEELLLLKGEQFYHDLESKFKSAIEIVAPSVPDPSQVFDSTKKSAEKNSTSISRADQLLNKMRTDPEILKVDPSQEKAWIAFKNLKDSESWETVRDRELTQEHAKQLTSLLNILVPSILSEEQFWTRYAYRVYQIQSQEQARQALLEATKSKEEAENEEFSWDDDHAETINDENVQNKPSVDENIPSRTDKISSVMPISRTSEESYDVVSTAAKSSPSVELASKAVEGHKRDDANENTKGDDDGDEETKKKESEDDSDWE